MFTKLIVLLFTLSVASTNVLGQGVSIPIGSSTFTAGAITLPFDFLAKNAHLTTPTVCQACNFDCLYVHNRYGGGIMDNPQQPDRYVCVCDNAPPQNGIIASAPQRCGSLNPATDGVSNEDLFHALLSVRESLLLCRASPNGVMDSSGCDVDCRTNHQYSRGGYCGYQNGVAQNPQQSQQTNPSQLFCVCNL